MYYTLHSIVTHESPLSAYCTITEGACQVNTKCSSTQNSALQLQLMIVVYTTYEGTQISGTKKGAGPKARPLNWCRSHCHVVADIDCSILRRRILGRILDNRRALFLGRHALARLLTLGRRGRILVAAR